MAKKRVEREGHKGVVPKVQTAIGWVREMRRQYGPERMKKGYNPRVKE